MGSLWSQKGIRLLMLGKFCCPNFIVSHVFFVQEPRDDLKDLGFYPSLSEHLKMLTLVQNLKTYLRLHMYLI